jgi:hypothetical protein
MARPAGLLPLTLEQAKALKRGDILNVYELRGQDFIRNADGTPARYKVTSVKTLKHSPGKIDVCVKWGIHAYFHLHEYMFQPPDGSGDGLGVVYKQDNGSVPV